MDLPNIQQIHCVRAKQIRATASQPLPFVVVMFVGRLDSRRVIIHGLIRGCTSCGSLIGSLLDVNLERHRGLVFDAVVPGELEAQRALVLVRRLQLEAAGGKGVEHVDGNEAAVGVAVLARIVADEPDVREVRVEYVVARRNLVSRAFLRGVGSSAMVL